MKTMKKIWHVIRAGGASLRWGTHPEEIRKYGDMKWEDVGYGQIIAFFLIGAPIFGAVYLAIQGLETLAYTSIALDVALISLIIRPIPDDK